MYVIFSSDDPKWYKSHATCLVGAKKIAGRTFVSSRDTTLKVGIKKEDGTVETLAVKHGKARWQDVSPLK